MPCPEAESLRSAYAKALDADTQAMIPASGPDQGEDQIQARMAKHSAALAHAAPMTVRISLLHAVEPQTRNLSDSGVEKIIAGVAEKFQVGPGPKYSTLEFARKGPPC